MQKYKHVVLLPDSLISTFFRNNNQKYTKTVKHSEVPMDKRKTEKKTHEGRKYIYKKINFML